MIKNRICTRCGAEYSPDSPSQRYCLSCRPIVYEEKRQARYERFAKARAEARKQRAEAHDDYSSKWTKHDGYYEHGGYYEWKTESDVEA